jgi:hypothetical protein
MISNFITPTEVSVSRFAPLTTLSSARTDTCHATLIRGGHTPTFVSIANEVDAPYLFVYRMISVYTCMLVYIELYL